jgi:hypothetical protein
MFGAGTRNRTTDLLITNQLLYQLSYAGFGLEFVEGGGLFRFKASLTRVLLTIVGRSLRRGAGPGPGRISR